MAAEIPAAANASLAIEAQEALASFTKENSSAERILSPKPLAVTARVDMSKWA